MDKGREGWELEQSAPPGTAVPVVTEAATEAQKAKLRREYDRAQVVKGRCTS